MLPASERVPTVLTPRGTTQRTRWPETEGLFGTRLSVSRAHLSCTGLPMGLPFRRQGGFSPWRRTLGHGNRRGPSFRPAL